MTSEKDRPGRGRRFDGLEPEVDLVKGVQASDQRVNPANWPGSEAQTPIPASLAVARAAIVYELLQETLSDTYERGLRQHHGKWARLLDFDEYRARVLMQAWQRAEYFQGTTQRQWLGWLRQIGRTVAITEARFQERQAASESQWTAGRPDLGPSALTADLFDAFVTILAPEEIRLLRMRYHDDLSFEEIAQILGITRKAAKQRHWRVLAKLRQHAEEF